MEAARAEEGEGEAGEVLTHVSGRGTGNEAHIAPRVETTRAGLALTAATLALPTAVVVGWSYGYFAGALHSRRFWVPFACALTAGWLALFLPRVLLRVLAPGAFRMQASAGEAITPGGRRE